MPALRASRYGRQTLRMWGALMTLQIKFRDVYGNEMMYPVNETAKLFAKIAGTKTITPQTLDLVQQLGIPVEVL